MKLEHLKLENFRGFSSFEISFEPSFTVLLGENMAGKSAVLDGAAVALSVVLQQHEEARDIRDDEVRQVIASIGNTLDLQPRFPVQVHARATFEMGERRFWTCTRDASNEPTTARGLSRLLSNQAESLTLIAQYGAQRHWVRDTSPEDLRGVGSRYDGYAGCFNITSTHKLLAGWMRKQTLVQLQRGPGHVQSQLAAVEAAVKCCVNDVTRFWFDVQYDELRLQRADGDIQSFAMLSEGVRNMVAMVADIAWRAAVLNPHHGSEANLLTDGVVLIDELDLHLHPAWQRRVVDDLRRTFPNIQFIVTTHSPQIVASVTRAQVRLLERNRLVGAAPHVEGRAANEILEDVFGVPARPEAVEAEIKALYQLIEDEAFAAARAQLAKLRERLGPEDSDIVRVQWILDTEDPTLNEQPTAAP